MIENRFILNFAPSGIIPTREMSPYVPLSSREIIEDVVQAAELGINMVHLHARDPFTNQPAYQKEFFREMITAIRHKCPRLVICVSTSGRLFNEFEKRADCLDLRGDARPDFASLTLSSLNFNKEASINSPEMIQQLAARMLERNIRPELEVFDLGMINYARYLIKKGLIKPPYYFNFILGNIACAQADMLHLGMMIRDLPENSIWSVGGVGDFQLKMNAMALVAGGGVRVGLEDNLWFDSERTRLATNRELLERVLSVAGALGLKPLGLQETRELLGLEPFE